MKGSYKIGQCHPLATTISANMRDIIRIPIRLKIATGTYILQANRASFNRSQLNPICLLCGNSEETLEHFLLIKVITKLPNSEQSYKGKVKIHNYINRQNQSTTGKL